MTVRILFTLIKSMHVYDVKLIGCLITNDHDDTKPAQFYGETYRTIYWCPKKFQVFR